MINPMLTLIDSKQLDIVPEMNKPGSVNPGLALCYENEKIVLPIVAKPEISHNLESTMSQRFIKFIPSEETEYLLMTYPNAFLLLCLIACRARRISGNPDGLEIGEAHIGDYKSAGIESRQKYRTALAILEQRAHIKKCETCRNRKKSTTVSTTGSNTYGTKVKILRSDVWDINADDQKEQINHYINHRSTTDQPPINHEQERKRKKKNEEEKEDSFHSSFSNPAKSPRSKKNSDELFFSFENKKFENISDQDHLAWLAAYPGVDFRKELAKATEWILSNPTKARKRTHWRRFLTSWFSKASDSALYKAASFSQKQENDKEKNWSTENRQSFFRWKSESKEALKHMEYQGDFVINRKNGKEISTKMAPSAFLESFTHIAGVRANG